MNIDPKFIDVAFEKDPKYTFGAKPRGKFAGPNYEDVVELIPESRWQQLSEEMDAENSSAEYLISRIYNQGQEGSCVANASCQAHEIVQAIQFGIDKVIPLSAISLYKRIGSSAQSGAMVEDGIEEMVKRGVLPLDTPENRAKFGNMVMPNTGFRTPYPSGHESVMLKLRAHEWNPITSVAGLMTAGFKRHPVVVGRAGHSICYVRPRWDSKWLWKYVNSWGDWGDAGGKFTNGFGYDSQRLFNESAQWAYALRTVVTQ
jgi:hypothetical protein